MPEAHITPREKEVLKWMADGKTAWEIAGILTLSEHTIRNHIKNVRRKLHADNSIHLMATAFRHHIIT
ncbi:LuxR family transcriptional regulator protein [Rhizobium phage RHph_Y25]|nr:LuxR family transcriptional regulator protein [Rhizobium phage RHph_Y25]